MNRILGLIALLTVVLFAYGLLTGERSMTTGAIFFGGLAMLFWSAKTLGE
ncbi:MAG: hypothetical protein ABSB53_05455 [Nitrososphaerales archaeon]|jgi:hypothetical protein